jgi:[Skp1-protein]-hydroxyproline N-acetylglucosaminyltransferase
MMLSANEGDGNGGHGVTNTNSGNNSNRQRQQAEREQRKADREAGNRSGGGGGGDRSDNKGGREGSSSRRNNTPTTKRRNPSSINTLVFNPFFILFLGLLTVSCLISFFLVFSHPEGVVQPGSSQEQAAVLLDSHGRRLPPKPNDESQRMGLGGSGGHRLSDAEQRQAIMHGLDNVNKKIITGGNHIDAAKSDNDAEDKEDTDDDDDDSTDKDDDDEDEDGDEDTEVPDHVSLDNLNINPKKKRANHEPHLTPTNYVVKPFDTSLTTPHLIPKFEPLPTFSDTSIFYDIPNQIQLIDDLINNNKPTIAGIIAFMNEYHKKLHQMHKRNSESQSRDKTGNNIDEMLLINSYFDLTKKEIDPLDNAYRGRTIFPIRDDESLFISLAAFREHLLGKSLMSAFNKAKHPDKLFFGIVVQNCYGIDGTICQTGVEVIGNDKNGHPITSISPKPPDANGIDEFCNTPQYKKYCDSGQVRVIYIHDTDALGPQTARYYASKLWGGETYFMQMDAHLEFAPEWDKYYIDEAKASKNYPKTVLSAYPPGFQNYDGAYAGGTPGARLCNCQFSTSPVENHILRISMGGNTPHDAPYPTQIPFIAAGFFFAHSSFLKDVPFDPYAPWCFMGEEIALSVRSWTMGWNIVSVIYYYYYYAYILRLLVLHLMVSFLNYAHFIVFLSFFSRCYFFFS